MSEDGRITKRTMRGESENATVKLGVGDGDESMSTPTGATNKNDASKGFTFTLAKDEKFLGRDKETDIGNGLLPVGETFTFDDGILAKSGLIPWSKLNNQEYIGKNLATYRRDSVSSMALAPSQNMPVTGLVVDRTSRLQVPTLPTSVSASAQQPLQYSSGVCDRKTSVLQERISRWNRSLSMFDPKPPYPERPTTSSQQLLGHHLFGSQPLQQADGQYRAPDPVTNILHVIEQPYDNPTMNNMGGHNYGAGDCLGLQHSTHLRKTIVDGSGVTGQLWMNAAKNEAAIPLSQQKHGDTTGKETINDVRRNMAFLASELTIPSSGFTAPEMEMDEELEELQKLVDAGIMKEDAPLYLAALKKRFNSRQRLPANLKHVMEWKIVSERESDHRYAVRNGEVPPADSINVYNMGAIRQLSRDGGAITDHMVATMKKVRTNEDKVAGNFAYMKALAESKKEIQEGPDCACQKGKGAWKTVPEPGLL